MAELLHIPASALPVSGSMGIISAWTLVQAPLVSTAKVNKKAVNAKHPPLFLHYLNKN